VSGATWSFKSLERAGEAEETRGFAADPDSYDISLRPPISNALPRFERLCRLFSASMIKRARALSARGSTRSRKDARMKNADKETLQLKWIDDVPKLQIENSDTIEAMRSNNLKA